MGVNIKLPIGLMFTLLGILLSIYGMATASDTQLYQKSLDINLNLWTGLGMLVIGGILLISLLFRKRQVKEAFDKEA